MSALICNLPSVEVWVRKEYLTDHQSGHGEFVKGVWVSAKSIPGRTFYFETYLPEYAAMYDKLPISAFVSEPELPDPDMNLPNLQFWNCMDYGIVSVTKQFIGSMDYELYTRDYGIQKGTYICTLDNYHQDPEVVDYATSENPAEHKSHNLIELNNGQYALYPNNRMRIFDNSLTPVEPKMPDFKVSTQYYQVENGFDRLGMGREDEYFWKTAKEQENSPKKENNDDQSWFFRQFSKRSASKNASWDRKWRPNSQKTRFSPKYWTFWDWRGIYDYPPTNIEWILIKCLNK